jgi:hypothetical protein
MINENLLRIASRVKAAVNAYLELSGLQNEEKWQAGFQGELVSVYLHGILITLHLK